MELEEVFDFGAVVTGEVGHFIGIDDEVVVDPIEDLVGAVGGEAVLFEEVTEEWGGEVEDVWGWGFQFFVFGFGLLCFVMVGVMWLRAYVEVLCWFYLVVAVNIFVFRFQLLWRWRRIGLDARLRGHDEGW